MIIGVAKEIKDRESRVSITPEGSCELANKHIFLYKRMQE